MNKIPMQDVVVVVPGIMGSVLQQYDRETKEVQDIWTFKNVCQKALVPNSEPSFDSLLLTDDSPEPDDLDDDIQATRLFERPCVIPGFGKVGDFQKLRNELFKYFDLEMGEIQSDNPANYFEFPYDWRRSNTVSAKRLKAIIDRKLELWRNSDKGVPDSQVILIAHSMGGLVCRHYLEVLEGWKDCRLLMTLGTPHRGSVNALDRLCNGMSIGYLDLTDLARSFTSIYELLPIYPVVEAHGEIYRVTELSELPHINQELATRSLLFHRTIEEHVNRNKDQSSYRENFEIVPVIGIGQRTLQSAQWSENQLVCDVVVPSNIHQNFQTGDGTVPGFSSIPIELTKQTALHRKFGETHAGLQENNNVLDLISDLLNTLQTNRSQGAPIQGELERNPPQADFPFLSVTLQDYYSTEESINIEASINNIQNSPESLVGRIEPIYGSVEQNSQIPFQRNGASWQLNIPQLEPGLYRFTLSSTPRIPGLSAIHDYFMVGS